MALKTCCSLLLSCLALSAAARDMDDQFAVFGIGAENCAAYLVARDRGGQSERWYQDWLAGYLSAVNTAAASTYDIRGNSSMGYKENKRPFCPGPAAAYRQRSATSLSDHPERAPNSADIVQNLPVFSLFTPPSQPPGKPGPYRGSRYSVLSSVVLSGEQARRQCPTLRQRAGLVCVGLLLQVIENPLDHHRVSQSVSAKADSSTSAASIQSVSARSHSPSTSAFSSSRAFSCSRLSSA